LKFAASVSVKSPMLFVRLPSLAILDVVGKDASKIANNVCTANVETIAKNSGREAFITDIRGKTLGHVCIYRTDVGLRLIGAGADEPTANQSIAIAAHFDKYTLREHSIPEDRSLQLAGIVVDEALLTKLNSSIVPVAASPSSIDLFSIPFLVEIQSNETLHCHAYRVPWWSEMAVLLLVDLNQGDLLAEHLQLIGGTEVGNEEFHRRRIENCFPWFGVDIDANHLPQEADRDEKAISFTKGCYLGQETVARLDALGQVQKKLVRWSLLCDSQPVVDTELKDGDRVVGRLTSVAKGQEARSYISLGFARRSHFDSGCEAKGNTEDGKAIEARVSGPR